MSLKAVLLFAALASCAHAQHTAQTSVAPILRECYVDPILSNRNNLPPATMGVLIDIIQNIEDNPNVNVDLRQLSALLLHSYRQDGLEFHPPDAGLALVNILPFSATHFSFHRHRLLLTRLIPNNLPILANDTISPALKCALHHMLSTTVDSRMRNDESACNQLSQYRALRLPRAASDSVKDDVEIIDLSNMNSVDKNGQMRDLNPSDDVEEYENVGGAHFGRQTVSESQCPILGGVVHTTWGAVSGGNLIAGIAAGAEPQRVIASQLTKNPPSNANEQFVNSIYPATLSGDLAEASLIQGTERGSRNIIVGATGGWNSTQARRFHMSQSRINLEMTDPEIRGGIDGFVLGNNIQSTLNSYSQLKLSQLLDMYYTAKNGVFDINLRACNRRDLGAQLIVRDALNTETIAFAAALDSNIPLRGTMMAGLDEVVGSAVDNFQNYANNNLNDASCIATVASAMDFRLRTNLYVVVDATWQYDTIYPAISYLLDSIEVSKFGSSVTLLSAFDGSIVVNKTFSLSEFHSNYTLAQHQSLMTGVNLVSVYSRVRSMMLNELDLERTRNYIGGNSTVLLFLLNTANLNVNNELWEEARAINDTIPDLRVLYATSTNHFDVLWNIVRDMNNDISVISLTSNAANFDFALAPVLNRIRRVGRRIVNPNCGSAWNGGLSGSHNFNDFVEPDYINFYTIAPNYFYVHNENRRIRISRTGGGAGSLMICYSRLSEQPRQSDNNNADQCQSLNTGNMEIPIRNACDDYWTINTCPPLYISVQSITGDATTSSAICTENACRFPYNIRYQVSIEDLGCDDGVGSIAANFALIAAALFLSTKMWY